MTITTRDPAFPRALPHYWFVVEPFVTLLQRYSVGTTGVRRCAVLLRV